MTYIHYSGLGISSNTNEQNVKANHPFGSFWDPSKRLSKNDIHGCLSLRNYPSFYIYWLGSIALIFGL